MFTGIVEELGVVWEIQKGKEGAYLAVSAEKAREGLRKGDSLAVNGVCLTVTTLAAKGFTVEIMPETLAKTNLGKLRPGEKVNLERALALGEHLGGHLVSGHVDGTGTILRREKVGIAFLLTIQAPPEVFPYLVPKGSVAVDGVSLTVVNCVNGSFTVSLTPHTYTQTTLGFKKEGATVNLEADLLAKYLAQLLQNLLPRQAPAGSRINLDFLAQHGYL